MKVRYSIAVLVALTGLCLELSVRLAYGHGGDPTLIHACVNNSSGAIKFVGPNSTCQNNETAVDWEKASRITPATFTVDCDAGQTITDALGQGLIPGDTLLVSGTCNENVAIPEEIHRITLDGQGAATVNGPDPTEATIEVRGGTGITIKGFTITGSGGGSGQSVVSVNKGGTATIDENNVQSASAAGIQITRNSSAVIINNTIQTRDAGIQVQNSSIATIGGRGTPNIIQSSLNDGVVLQGSSAATIIGNTISNNGLNGIRLRDNSYARIGFASFSDTTPTPNTIIQNNRNGISISSSNAGIAGNTISNNALHGVLAERVSHAAISGNTIDSNGNSEGIRVEENSGVNLASTGGDAAFLNASNTGNNTGFGLRCRFGGYARGSIGTLTGVAGQKSFDATCIDATSP